MVEVAVWLLLISLPIVVRVVLLIAPLRRLGQRQGRRLWAWLVRCWDRTEEDDPLAEDLWRAVRSERLHADLLRLQRLLVTDAWMSATRQIGNRLAYAWVQGELDRDAEAAQLAVRRPPRPYRRPRDSRARDDLFVEPATAATLRREAGSQREVLEIGWRPRRERISR